MKVYKSVASLAKEIDYQIEYTYEQRIDLFNKYYLSTSTKYINPLMLLVDHLRRAGQQYGQFSGFSFKGVSHSGAVKTAFNEDLKASRSKYVEIQEVPFLVLKVKHWNHQEQKMEQVTVFVEKGGEVRFSFVKPLSFWPRRGYDFYQAAEEFCKDFGFNIKWK